LPSRTPPPEPSSTLYPTNTQTLTPTQVGGGSGQIAFASDITGVNQIYYINVDGTGRQPITDVAEGACQPGWSPDGQKLVFISPCNANKDYYPSSVLFIINVDGTGLLPLPTLGGGDYDPAWSPDGARIAFTSLRSNGRPHIHIYSLLDNTTIDISTEYAFDNQPAWSADGKQIIFSSSNGNFTSLWVMDADGSNRKQFSASNNYLNTNSSWSPDGMTVLFTQLTAVGGIPRLMVAPFQFTDYTEFRLGQESLPMREAVFSLDGYWIAYEGWMAGFSHDIYIMAVTGAGRQQVTTEPRIDFDPAWRPLP
jgi:Tol biopolymer transport system component